MIKILGLIGIIALVVPHSFLTQEPVPQKPPGPIVELRLIVTGKDGRSVDTISKDEIQIIEDKVGQTVLTVERKDRPIAYGLLIDSSNSLNRLIGAAVEGAKMIIINRRGLDEMFIERFISSDKIDKLQDFTTDNTALLESLKQIRLEGGQSAIIDALYLGAEHVAQHKSGQNWRKVIVIITDGEDRNSYHKLNALRSLLRKTGIQVFALGLVIDLDKEAGFTGRSAREKAEKLLNTLAEESGGRVLYPRTGPELIKATAEIIIELRRSPFVVTYQSSQGEKKGPRNLDVKVTSPGGEKRRVVVHYVGPNDDQSKQKEQKSQ
jgi:Ca-activated chloride channel homolog